LGHQCRFDTRGFDVPVKGQPFDSLLFPLLSIFHFLPSDYVVLALSSALGAEPDFADQSFVLQVAERVVDGCECDSWQYLSRTLKDLIRGQVLVRLADYLKDSPALFRKSQVFEIHFS
jgi:hypothetical protein